MTSYGPEEPHWSDPARQTMRRDIERNTRPQRAMSNLAPLAVLHNAVYYPNFRASATEPPTSLPLDTISHLFYAFAAVNHDGTVYLSNPLVDVQTSIDGAQGALRACSNLKQARPYLRCILSIGGAEGSKENFAATAADSQRRINFAYSAKRLVDQYNFDGIDVDWEYPEPGQQASDYMLLTATLREFFPGPRYLLTTALPAADWCLGRFDLQQLATTLDLLNLMAYDFTGNWGNPIVSGHHAQLHAPHGGNSGAAAVQYAISNGFPANKIMLGCPAYGWSFLHCNNINQTTTSCGNHPSGCFDFAHLPRPGTQELTDEACVATYCIGGDGGFVSYDNPRSVQIKARWAKSMGLAGMFFWHALSDAKGTRSLVYSSYVALHS